MDDEKEGQPPFRWNRQAVFMLFFFMLAMALPLMGVAWFARGYLSAQQAAAAEPARKAGVNVEPLRAALENVAAVQFSDAARLDDGEDEISIPTDEVASNAIRIAELAQAAGGGALEMTTSEPGAKRLGIRVPATRVELLRKAIRGDRVDFSSVPAGVETKLVRVVVKKP